MCFVYTIASIRTNVVFFLIFVGLDLAMSILAGAFWQLGHNNPELGAKLLVVSGTCTMCSMLIIFSN